jgi:tetratricopeptide (TPR) repeat protein
MLQTAIDKNQDLTFANVLLGIIDFNNEKYENAITNFKKFLAKPTDDDYINIARTQIIRSEIELKDWDKAVVDYNLYFKDSTDIEDKELLGVLYLNWASDSKINKGKSVETTELCNKALKIFIAIKTLNPKNLWVDNQIGRTYLLLAISKKLFDKELLDKALDELLEGQKINNSEFVDSNIAATQFYIGEYFRQQGWAYAIKYRKTKDKKDLQTACENFRNSKENYENALLTFEKVYKKNPKFKGYSKNHKFYTAMLNELVNDKDINKYNCFK